MKLSIEHGTFGYDRAHPILKDISFEAASGDLVAILGPNGAGKTTLLRCMMGFLKWQNGGTFLDGKVLSQIPYQELWRTIAYVPQAKNTHTGFTAREMILLGRSSHLSLLSHPHKADLEKADQIMEELHITKLRDKMCSEVSGGELQMILIGRALAGDPKLLVLDEPESNLDFKNQLIVLETMSSLASRGLSCIFNTHYPAHALQRANRSCLLCRNGEYQFGDTSQIVTETNIEHAFGVNAVIGEIETPDHIWKNVIPTNISSRSDTELSLEAGDDRRSLAVLAIIIHQYEMAETVNELLHQYGSYIVGRMGMPYPDCGLYIINVTLDAPHCEITKLADHLNILHGISVKTTYAADSSMMQQKEGTNDEP